MKGIERRMLATLRELYQLNLAINVLCDQRDELYEDIGAWIEETDKQAKLKKEKNK